MSGYIYNSQNGEIVDYIAQPGDTAYDVQAQRELLHQQTSRRYAQMLPSSFYAPTPTTPIIPVHGTFGDELTIERVQRQLHIWKLEDGVGLDRSSVGLWFSGMFDDPDEESLRYWLRAQEEKRAREEARARRSTRYRLIALAGSLTTVVIFLVTVFLAGLL